MTRKKAEKREDLFLNADELNKIKSHEQRLKEMKLELMIQELRQENIQLKAQLELNRNSTIIKMSKDSIADKIRDHEMFMKELASKRKIEGKWSFSPETGEVIKED